MNILFVCTGNTCRSPMAEALAKKIFFDKDIKFSSRGLSAFNQPISQNAILALQDYGISFSEHISETLLKTDIETADLILTMTGSHKNIIINAMPEASHKADTLYHYCFDIDKDIQDPFMGTLDDYKACCDEINKCITKLGVIL